MSASDAAANSAFTALTSGVDFAVPVTDINGTAYQLPANAGPLHSTVPKLTNADLTTGTVSGTGTFDQLMLGFKAHLDGEFKANRISGAEYTKAFIALTEGAMSNAVQFLLGKDAAYWQALGAQMQAQLAEVQLVTARVGLEAAKAQLRQVQIEAERAKADYALTKMKLASETASYDAAAFTVTYMLPKQLDLVKEQIETQRSQTLDTRTDGATVVGSVGKQKALYSQQIVSYQRDAEVKAAKIFTDAWITQKSMDEGTLPPDAFNNNSLQNVLVAIKAANGFT